MDPATPLGRSTRTTTSGSPATMWSTANNGIRREHLEGDRYQSSVSARISPIGINSRVLAMSGSSRS
jgi:hypothetical protein